MTIAGSVILAVIAATLWWKKRAPRFVATALFLVGVGGAALVTEFLGAEFAAMSILGVGVFTVLALFSGITFWEEVIKKNKPHKVRTPLVSFLFGVTLMTATGSGFAALQNAVQATSSKVDKVVTTTVNEKTTTSNSSTRK